MRLVEQRLGALCIVGALTGSEVAQRVLEQKGVLGGETRISSSEVHAREPLVGKYGSARHHGTGDMMLWRYRDGQLFEAHANCRVGPLAGEPVEHGLVRRLEHAAINEQQARARVAHLYCKALLLRVAGAIAERLPPNGLGNGRSRREQCPGEDVLVKPVVGAQRACQSCSKHWRCGFFIPEGSFSTASTLSPPSPSCAARLLGT